MALRLLLAILLGVWISADPSVASAQRDPSMDSLLESFELEGKRADRSPVPPSELSDVNMKVHWRLFKQMHADGEPGREQIEALVHDGRSVGWVNQTETALAMSALALREDDPELARAMFDGAQRLAPDVPYPWLLEAQWTLDRQPGKIGNWGRAMVNGIENAARWPDTSIFWALKLLTWVLVAWAFAAAVFLAGQSLRNFPILAYDLARVMPRGFSSNQTSVLLVAVVAIPGLVMKSPLVSLLLLLALLSLVQRSNERIVSLLVFGFVAALPYANDALGRLASYPDSEAQILARAQWVRCPDACREEVEGILARRPDDATVRFTALLAAFRHGETTDLQRVVEEVESSEWPDDVAGYAHNLAGAAQIALADPEAAMKSLDEARKRLPTSPAPPFNMMRAHQMLDDNDAAARALTEASAHDIDLVTLQLSYDRRDINSFFVAEPQPLPHFFARHFSEPEPQHAPVEPVWTLLAGDSLSLAGDAPLLGGAGALLVLLGWPLRRRTSTPCPRCGLARDPTETHETANHVYCHPCYSTYVTGAMLDYDARVHNEKVLGRRFAFQRLGRRVASVVAPGLGHTLAGLAITGFVLAFFLATAALTIRYPLGFVRAPHELLSENWAGQIWIAWAVIAVIALVVLNAAVRDIPPVTVKEEKR